MSRNIDMRVSHLTLSLLRVWPFWERTSPRKCAFLRAHRAPIYAHTHTHTQYDPYTHTTYGDDGAHTKTHHMPSFSIYSCNRHEEQRRRRRRRLHESARNDETRRRRLYDKVSRLFCVSYVCVCVCVRECARFCGRSLVGRLDARDFFSRFVDVASCGRSRVPLLFSAGIPRTHNLRLRRATTQI